MSKIELINASCADQTVDVVVNAANSRLWAGDGICGVIFKKAGMQELTDAYYNSLKIMMDNGYHSISFPLISSGIFGGALSNPAGESTKQCCLAYQKFIGDFPDYEIDVSLCAFSNEEMIAASKEYKEYF